MIKKLVAAGLSAFVLTLLPLLVVGLWWAPTHGVDALPLATNSITTPDPSLIDTNANQGSLHS